MSTESNTQTAVTSDAPQPNWQSERPTFTITLPSGWARSALAGIEAALLGWLIPTLAIAVGFLRQSSNPWLSDTTVGAAGRAGTEFWATTLGSPAVFYGVSVSIVPLLWTLAQIVVFRALLLSGRSFGSAALWTSIPFYFLTVLIVLLASGAQIVLWQALLGAALISLVAVGWAVARQTEDFPRWVKKLRWVWSGMLVGLSWVAAVATVGALVLAAAFAASWSGVLEATQGLGLDRMGNIGIGALQILYIPVYMACGLAWLSGAGFTVLGGALSSAHAVASNEVAFLPVAAMVPTTAPGAWVPALLGLGGLALGVTFSVVISRASLFGAFRQGAVALGLFAVTMYLWMGASRGALGENLLAELGPTPFAWLVLTGLVGGIALVVGIALHPETRQRVSEGFGTIRGARSSDSSEDDKPQDTELADVDNTDASSIETEASTVSEGEGKSDVRP